MNKTADRRQANIELLRILAMVAIVLMHMVNHGALLDFSPSGKADYYLGWFLFSPGIHSIDIFLLISGYFLIEQKFSTWKIFRFATQVLFYALGITLLFWIFADIDKETKYMIYSIFPLASDFYWYPSMYVGMLLLSPILNKLIKSLTQNQLKCLCALCFVLVSAWPNIFFYSSTLNTAGGVSISWFLCVYIFGAYIRLYYKPDGKWVSKLILSIALMTALPLSRFFIEWLIKTPVGKLRMLEDLLWGYSVFYNYSSILVTITSILLFITFLNIKIESPTVSRWINIFAGASFGVYLIHDHAYIRENMWTFLKVYSWKGHWYMVPMAVIVTLLLYLAGSLIELLRKKLFLVWERSDKLKGFFIRIDDRMSRIWHS